ncbi:Protocadherin-16 [Manis pentadactyla]|nr:Protocadherin-16 [Manis pentadactyla]
MCKGIKEPCGSDLSPGPQYEQLMYNWKPLECSEKLLIALDNLNRIIIFKSLFSYVIIRSAAPAPPSPAERGALAAAGPAAAHRSPLLATRKSSQTVNNYVVCASFWQQS